MAVPRPAKFSTRSIGSAEITNDSIINEDIKTDAAIAFSKLAALDSTYLLVGSAANVATKRAITGDVTISNTGVTSIAAGSIVNADVNNSAAIAYSKLNLTGQLLNADVNAAAAISTSKLAAADHLTDGLDKLEKVAIFTYDYDAEYTSDEFAADDVNTEDDIIVVADHGLETGDPVDFTTADTLPTGITAATAYYVIKLTDGTFKIAATYADAVAEPSVPVNITAAGTGPHTVHRGRFGQIRSSFELPADSLITGGVLDVMDAFIDIDDGTTNTEAIMLKGANDVFSALNLTKGRKNVVPSMDGSSAIKLTADSHVVLTIAAEQIKAGKLRVYLRYVEGEADAA